jgi:hypothetical protein
VQEFWLTPLKPFIPFDLNETSGPRIFLGNVDGKLFLPANFDFFPLQGAFLGIPVFGFLKSGIPVFEKPGLGPAGFFFWDSLFTNPQHPIKLFEYKFDTAVDALNKTKTRRELNILFISILSINTHLLIRRKFKSKKITRILVAVRNSNFLK